MTRVADGTSGASEKPFMISVHESYSWFITTSETTKVCSDPSSSRAWTERRIP
jgi:hypothetical protein